MPTSHETPESAPQADLRFERRGAGPTFLARQRAGYPFHVGRVLPCADAPAGAASILVQSCSGGLFEHDRVALQVKVCGGAAARVGSAAATVVHSMTRGIAVSKVRLEAESGSWLEYLPLLCILFPQASLVSELDVTLHPGALIVLTDAFLLHDPEGRARPFEVLDTCITVRDETRRLLARDRVRVTGALWKGANAGVAAIYAAQGSLLVLTRSHDAHELAGILRAALADLPDVYVGVGALPNQCGVCVRILADGGVSLRVATLRAGKAIRATLVPTPVGPAPAVSRQQEDLEIDAVSP